MKKVIKLNKNYTIIVKDSEKYSDEEIKATIKEAIKHIRNSKHIKDIPVTAPEDEVTITYNEKIPSGKSELTNSMFKTALKERWKDGGQTADRYFQEILESINSDIENAKYLVSGETKDTRMKLLKNYIDVENILIKYNQTEKLEQLKPLVDKLSDLLKLDSWPEPTFTENDRIRASAQLRRANSFDSHIYHKYSPVFLCTPSELKATYVDAKAGKMPEVFEANLKKVEKDMLADYERINAGKDTYTSNPLIRGTLYDIVKHYETALSFAEDLGYNEYAERFEEMLDTIKNAWSAYI